MKTLLLTLVICFIGCTCTKNLHTIDQQYQDYYFGDRYVLVNDTLYILKHYGLHGPVLLAKIKRDPTYNFEFVERGYNYQEGRPYPILLCFGNKKAIDSKAQVDGYKVFGGTSYYQGTYTLLYEKIDPPFLDREKVRFPDAKTVGFDDNHSVYVLIKE